MGRVLIVAPHPDDEVLGCGGTMAKLSRDGDEVYVLIATRGDELFDQELIEKGIEEARKAHRLLGVKETIFSGLPAVKLDTVPQHQINDLFSKTFREVAPDLIFLPFPGDVNNDHRVVHACAMVAARPVSIQVRGIYCYETLSSTNWASPCLAPGFSADTFIDISETIELKVRALETYASQVKKYPHERSPEAVINLSRFRGGFINAEHAEAFMCVRQTLA